MKFKVTIDKSDLHIDSMLKCYTVLCGSKWHADRFIKFRSDATFRDPFDNYYVCFIDYSLCFVFALLILLSSAWSQEEVAPPVRKSNLLARRPVGGRGLGRGALTTTTTTTAAPSDEEILENAEEAVEENNEARDSENGKFWSKGENTHTLFWPRAPKLSTSSRTLNFAIYFFLILCKLRLIFWQVPMNQLQQQQLRRNNHWNWQSDHSVAMTTCCNHWKGVNRIWNRPRKLHRINQLPMNKTKKNWKKQCRLHQRHLFTVNAVSSTKNKISAKNLIQAQKISRCS